MAYYTTDESTAMGKLATRVDAIKRDADTIWNGKNWFSIHRVQMVRNLLSRFQLNDKYLLEARSDTIADFDIPWMFVPFLFSYPNCYLWQALRELVGIWPTYCRTSCYKVVVTVSTLRDLFKLERVMEQLYERDGHKGKCGVDLRDYTAANYAGFLYNTGKALGERCWRNTEELVKRAIPSATVILKRGCTEMEAVKPSSEWGEPTDEEIEIEAMYLSMFDTMNREIATMSPWFKNRIRHKWICRARELGDPTYKEMFGDDFETAENFFSTFGRGNVKAVTYHPQEEV